MPRRTRKVVRKRGRKRKIVPGYGGMVGRGLGWARKNMTSKGSTMNWLLKKTKQLADAVNIEYKHVDITNIAGSVDYNGGLSSLVTSITQGVSDNNRIGDSMKLQNLVLRFIGVRNTADSILRVMVIFDPMNKLAAVTDVLQITGSALAVISPKNYDKRFQSRVLYDRTMTLTTADHPYVLEDVTIQIDQHTQFNSGTTTINTGDLKLLVISNVVTTNLPTFTYFARVSYTDD